MVRRPEDKSAAEAASDAIAIGPPEPPTHRPMTLQEAAGAFRPMLNGWRGMVRMGEAVEAALTAEQHTRQLEQRGVEAQTALDKLAEDRKLADEGLALARQGLVGVQDATRLAREELETVRRQITEAKATATREQDETRKAWDAERKRVEQEFNAASGRLAKMREEIAAVVKANAA